MAILGVGQMGLVCAGILAGGNGEGVDGVGGGVGGGGGEPRAEVVMWGHSADEVGSLAQTRRSPRLPGFVLPESVRVTASAREALAGAKLVVTAVPVQFTRGVWEGMRDDLPPGAAIVSVSKGIENRTLLRPLQIVADVLGERHGGSGRPVGVLSGPTIAAELARCLPATMIAASEDPEFELRLQRMFTTSWLRIYTSEDVIGVEVAGAVKNVIAIAAGILDGLGAGFNAKSALLARGMAEIARLGVAMGAKPETFFGIAGVGDLATSCFSPEGRNRSCGEALGKGESLESYLKRTTSVVEGVATTRSVVDLARKLGVEMPIAEAVHAVLFEGMDPIEGIGRLMSRELKREVVA